MGSYVPCLSLHRMNAGPVVVVVLCHKDPPQVRRLVGRLLEGPRTSVVVHHDPRGPLLRLEPDDRVHVHPDPKAAHWGRLDMAEMMIDALRFARSRVPELSWVLLVSGQDYPCTSMTAVEEELGSTTVNAFVRHFRVDGDPADDVHPWQALTRRRYLRRRRIPLSRRSHAFPRRHPFGEGLHLYAGDMWVNLDAQALDHVIEQHMRLTPVLRYLRAAPIPDEALLPTLLLNDADHLTVSPDRRRFLRWVPGALHPETLTRAHLEDIRGSGDFFARKVAPGPSDGLIDELDLHHGGPALRPDAS